jgi:hypothetical protein
VGGTTRGGSRGVPGKGGVVAPKIERAYGPREGFDSARRNRGPTHPTRLTAPACAGPWDAHGCDTAASPKRVGRGRLGCNPLPLHLGHAWQCRGCADIEDTKTLGTCPQMEALGRQAGRVAPTYLPPPKPHLSRQVSILWRRRRARPPRRWCSPIRLRQQTQARPQRAARAYTRLSHVVAPRRRASCGACGPAARDRRFCASAAGRSHALHLSAPCAAHPAGGRRGGRDGGGGLGTWGGSRLPRGHAYWTPAPPPGRRSPSHRGAAPKPYPPDSVASLQCPAGGSAVGQPRRRCLHHAAWAI